MLARWVITIGIIIILAAAGTVYYSVNRTPAAQTASAATALPEEESIPRPKNIGEQITYQVQLGKITLGTSRFNFLNAHLENNAYINEMIFETNLFRFSDTEHIFSDANTYLPITIERSVKNLFSKETIREEYDQKNYTVTIIKTAGGKTQKPVTIQKQAPIQNSILLPHYVRQLSDLQVGMEFKVNIPTRELTIKLASIESITVPAGTFQAYHFESIPQQVEIWISADEQRIPLRIQGMGNFGYTLVMKEYFPPKKELLP